jgi:hypothetical protein
MIPRPDKYLNWKDWAGKCVEALNFVDEWARKTLRTNLNMKLVFTTSSGTLGPVAYEYDERNGRFSAVINHSVAPAVAGTITITGLNLNGKTKLPVVYGSAWVSNPVLAINPRLCFYRTSTKTIEVSTSVGDVDTRILLIL